MMAAHFAHHRFERMRADLLLGAAAATYQVMMRGNLRDLVLSFGTASIGSDHDPDIDEDAKRSIEGRAVDLRIKLANAPVNIAQRGVTATSADCIED